MSGIATLTAQPKTLTVAGVERRFHPLTFADIGELQSWMDRRAADPLDAIRGRLDGLPEAIQRDLAREALRESCRPRPLFGTPEAGTLLGTVAGSVEVLHLMLRPGDPGSTREDAYAALKFLSDADLTILFALAEGRDATIGDESGPKAPAGPRPGPGKTRSGGGPPTTGSATTGTARPRKKSAASR